MLSLSFVRKYKVVFLISLFLFIVPFFWLKPGEMDLGGDDNRLFFYDPITYMKSASIYDIIVQGKGVVESRYYDIPYVSLIAVLKLIFPSPTTVINILNGIKFAGAFIGIYLIVYEFLKETHKKNNKKMIYTAAMLAGFFYVVSLGSFHAASYWNRALTSHNQIFLNPWIFYLLLKFFLTRRYKYLWVTLLISFIFAPNFSLTSVTPFFAFYPLALLFLFLYVKIFGKNPIPWKGVFIGGLLFVGVQAFHLFGQIISLFNNGNAISVASIFNKTVIAQDGVEFFPAVRGQGKAILNLLLPSGRQYLQWTSIVAPFVIIVGFLLDKGRRKELLLVSFFFIITFFLVTANITDIGFEFYRRLFYIPGFGMFRHFFVQWLFIFIFFYSLLFGLAANSILLKLKPFYAKFFYCIVFVSLLITGIPLFAGLLVNENIIRQSNNVKTVFEMDPRYEQTLNFVRTLPDDGKILVFPLTDFDYQVISGKNGGAYEGPTLMRFLTRKYSFLGYRDFGYRNNMPYANDVMKYSQEKNYDRLLGIFTVLNIRYIFYNEDSMIYGNGFFPGPSIYMQIWLPKTQDEYKDFIQHFPVKIIYKNYPFTIYEIDKSSYNSTIFIPDGVYQSNQLSFDKNKTHSVFIDKNICSKLEFKTICEEYKKPNVDVNLSMIDPTLYAVNLQAHESVDTMFLVMQHTFNKGWKLVIDGKYISEDRHIPVNGYANGWLIDIKNLPMKGSYTLFVKLDSQKYFLYGWIITGASLILIIGLLIFSFRKIHTKNE